MNFSTLLGFMCAIGVVYAAVFGVGSHPEIFLDPHAIILVVGGTLTVSLISFPIGKLFTIGKLFFRVVFFNPKTPNVDLVRNLVDAANVAKGNPALLNTMKAPHPFASEGYQLIAEGVLNEADMHEVLTLRSQFFKGTYLADAKVFHSLAKFPPAFGLLGAVTGMIAMMSKLGSSSSEAIGAAMGIALVATFWGIAVANLVLLPLAEFYHKLASDDAFQRSLIVEGLMMLKRRESPIVVMEKLNSFLPMSDRLMTGAEQGQKRAA